MSLKQRKLELLRKKREYIKYNKLEFYDPYPFQIEFHNDKEDRRALRAGNQIGKQFLDALKTPLTSPESIPTGMKVSVTTDQSLSSVVVLTTTKHATFCRKPYLATL